MIYNLFILIFCCSVDAQSTCLQGPVDPLPEGCKIGNLAATSTLPSYEDVIISDAFTIWCNIRTSTESFKLPPRVSLPLSYSQTSNSSNNTFLLVLVDRTNEKLFWMMSNLTLNTKEPNFIGKDSRTVLPLNTNNLDSGDIIRNYEPDFNHQLFTKIEFLVFEERRSNAITSYIDTKATYSSPFNLSAWIDSQKDSGITICGPVAGGTVIAVSTENVGNPNIFTRSYSNTLSSVIKIAMVLFLFLILLRIVYFGIETYTKYSRVEVVLPPSFRRNSASRGPQ